MQDTNTQTYCSQSQRKDLLQCRTETYVTSHRKRFWERLRESSILTLKHTHLKLNYNVLILLQRNTTGKLQNDIKTSNRKIMDPPFKYKLPVVAPL